MKGFKHLMVLMVLGLMLSISLSACQSSPKAPDEEKVRKDAEKGMKDLEMEEQHH